MFPIPVSLAIPKLDVDLKPLEKAVDALRELKPVVGGVAAVGEPAAYALVWEFGNVRQTKKGPKTTLGVNPDGRQVWLSIQAPYGYIRIHTPQFLQILEEEFGEVDVLADSTAELQRRLEAASKKASERIAEVIRNSAPFDSGDLRASIKVLSSRDPELLVAKEEVIGFGHEKVA